VSDNNIFSEPKQLKKWAIQVADACGGQRLEKGPLISALDTRKLDILVAEFVLAYNYHYEILQEQTTKFNEHQKKEEE